MEQTQSMRSFLLICRIRDPAFAGTMTLRTNDAHCCWCVCARVVHRAGCADGHELAAAGRGQGRPVAVGCESGEGCDTG